MTSEEIEALEALLSEATPGPWGEDDCNVFCRPISDARHTAIIAKIDGKPYDAGHIKLDAFVATTEQRHDTSDADARLIAALRNAAPGLLAAARENVEIRSALTDLIESISDYAFGSNAPRDIAVAIANARRTLGGE